MKRNTDSLLDERKISIVRNRATVIPSKTTALPKSKTPVLKFHASDFQRNPSRNNLSNRNNRITQSAKRNEINSNNPFLIGSVPKSRRNEGDSNETSKTPTNYDKDDDALLNDPTAFWNAWSLQRQHMVDCENVDNDDIKNSKLRQQMKGCNCFEGLGSVM